MKRYILALLLVFIAIFIAITADRKSHYLELKKSTNPISSEKELHENKQKQKGPKNFENHITDSRSKHALTPTDMEAQIQNALYRYAITRDRDELFDLFKRYPKLMIDALMDSGHHDLIGYFQGILLKDEALVWFDDNLDSRQKNRAFIGYAEHLMRFDPNAAVRFMQGLDYGVTRDIVTQHVIAGVSKSSPQNAWKVFVSEHEYIRKSSGSTYTLLATNIVGDMLYNSSRAEFVEFINSDQVSMLDPSLMVDISVLVSAKYPTQSIELLENIKNDQHLDNAIALIGRNFFEQGDDQSIGVMIDQMKERISSDGIFGEICKYYFSDGNDSGIAQMSSNKPTKYDYSMFRSAAKYVTQENTIKWINYLESGARRDGLIDGVVTKVQISRENDASEWEQGLTDPAVIRKIVDVIQQ